MHRNNFSKNLGLRILALALLSAVVGCGYFEDRPEIVTTVAAINIPEKFVVIPIGRNHGVKVGDEFGLSRDIFLTASVEVFEVADALCKARGTFRHRLGGPEPLDRVQIGDKARFSAVTSEDRIFNLVFQAQVIGFPLVVLLVCWLVYLGIWKYVTWRHFWDSNFLRLSLGCVRVWFWFLFLVSAYFSLKETYWGLYVEGLYLQNLILIYPLIGALMFGTFVITGLLIVFTRLIQITRRKA